MIFRRVLVGFLWAFSSLLQGSSPPECIESLVLVGPYSSGKRIAPLARNRKFQTVALITETPPEGYDFIKGDFDEVIPYRGESPMEIAEKLFQRGSIRAIIPGSEWDPVLTDKVRDSLRQLGLESPGNTSHLAEARRDKSLFFEALSQSDPPVPAPRQHYSDDLYELTHWAEQHGQWPVVVKPVKNAGTTGVTFCYSVAEVEAAFRSILNRKNKMGEVDYRVLIQEKLDGPEYALNGVRSGGKTRFTGIWSYERKEVRGAATAYVADKLLPYEGEIQKALVQRALQVLDAVHLTDGPFHLEQVLTADRGPLPIDLGARLSGGNLPLMESLATNRNPFEMTLDAFVNAQALSELPQGYTRKRFVTNVHIGSEGGRLASRSVVPALDFMVSQGEIEGYYLPLPDGTPLRQSVDFGTTIGHIRIMGDNEADVERRVQMFKNWIAEGRFERKIPELLPEN